ncbi:uncharacterized protein LOC141641101 [Silene latifolia]|uniref:uncharacterized protein LOC141641101 n=1 Tax=Silene latifolia TaxID=37657 RepID=UPI003D76E9AC
MEPPTRERQLALELGVRNLQIPIDSLLIVNHVNDEFIARDSKMIAYLKVAKELKQKFKDCKLKQIPRDQNVEADALATLGVADQSPDQPAAQADDWDWRTPYLNWLRHSKLPDDKKEIRGFKMKASRFILIDDVLFRKSLAGPYLRCLDKQEAQNVLHALHSRECGNHARGRCLSNKALRQGDFWPRGGQIQQNMLGNVMPASAQRQ